MSTDEQRVRTMAGWIGVEISKSRVRTPGRAGYGLYRVRGSVAHRTPAELAGLAEGSVTADGVAERGPWTPYAFTLEQIDAQVALAIQAGKPDRPGALNLYPADGRGLTSMISTRWTQAYRGRRDLGLSLGEVPHESAGCHEGGRPHPGPCVATAGEVWVDDEPVPVTIKPEFGAEVSVLVALVDAGLAEVTHVQGCMCEGTARLTAACVQASMTTRQRQREHNAAFQAEHLERRAWGLRARYAEKERRNARRLDGGALPPHSAGDESTGSAGRFP